MKKISYIILLILLSILTVNAESVFKPIHYSGDFELDYNYIITAYDSEEDAWYALSPYYETNAVKIDNPTKGITMTDKEVKTSEYVFKCSKKEAYYKIKLRSNLVDEESGKKYSLYLNKEQVFNLGGGTITFYVSSTADSTGLVPTYMGRNSAASMTFDTETNSFGYKKSYGYSNGTPVYVFTDATTMPVQEDSIKLNKINNLGQAEAVLSEREKNEKFQIVYTDKDNKSYIFTETGAKEVKVNSDGSITTKDYLYFFSSSQSSSLGMYDKIEITDSPIAINGKFLNIVENKYTFTEASEIVKFRARFAKVDSSVYPKIFNWFDKNQTKTTTNEEKEQVKYFNDIQYEILLDYNLYIGWDDTKKDFIITSYDKAIKFDLYTEEEVYETKRVEYYYDDGYSYTTYTSSAKPLQLDYSSNTEKEFLGWSTDPNVTNYITEEDKENLYTYNIDKKKIAINEIVIKKYSLIENFSEVKNTGEVIKLYWVGYKYSELTREPYIGKVDNKNIIGAIDWKNIQENKTEEYLEKKEKHQGSIFIEVYLDGEIFIPASKMYFRYDNDNTTDITIKFLNEEIENINTYLLEQENYYRNPHYNIVGIYAEQGGSEEGLYKKFNWIKDSGAQLDNVKGGSTVKIYLSSKYTLKYYLNDKLYEEDEFVYFPTITKSIIKANSKTSDYIVNSTTNEDLLNMTDTTEYFKEEDMARGKYFSFSYELLDLKDLVEISSLPNVKLTRDYWVIKDVDGIFNYKALPRELMQHKVIKNVDYIYMDETDEINTIHLYAYTPDNEPKVSEELTKISFPKEVENPETFDNLSIAMFIILVSAVGLISLRKRLKELS